MIVNSYGTEITASMPSVSLGAFSMVLSTQQLLNKCHLVDWKQSESVMYTMGQLAGSEIFTMLYLARILKEAIPRCFQENVTSFIQENVTSFMHTYPWIHRFMGDRNRGEKTEICFHLEWNVTLRPTLDPFFPLYNQVLEREIYALSSLSSSLLPKPFPSDFCPHLSLVITFVKVINPSVTKSNGCFPEPFYFGLPAANYFSPTSSSHSQRFLCWSSPYLSEHPFSILYTSLPFHKCYGLKILL